MESLFSAARESNLSVGSEGLILSNGDRPNLRSFSGTKRGATMLDFPGSRVYSVDLPLEISTYTTSKLTCPPASAP